MLSLASGTPRATFQTVPSASGVSRAAVLVSCALLAGSTTAGAESSDRGARAAVVEVVRAEGGRAVDVVVACSGGPCRARVALRGLTGGRTVDVAEGRERVVRLRVRRAVRAGREVRAMASSSSRGHVLRVRDGFRRPELPDVAPDLVAGHVLSSGSSTRLRFFATVSDGCPRVIRRTSVLERDGEVVVGFEEERLPPSPDRAFVCAQALRVVCLEVRLGRLLGRRSAWSLDGRRRVRSVDPAGDRFVEQSAGPVRRGEAPCRVVPPGADGVVL